MSISVVKIEDDVDKKKITRGILEALEDWFGIPEAREEYIGENSSNG